MKFKKQIIFYEKHTEFFKILTLKQNSEIFKLFTFVLEKSCNLKDFDIFFDKKW